MKWYSLNIFGVYMKKRIFILITALFILTSNSYAVTAFTGLAGGKLNYSANQDKSDYEPQLKLQAFFAGQFNFAPKVWSHLEFSIDTDNFLTDSIFKKTSARFRVDEISLTIKQTFTTTINYLSAFVGEFEPIGSDILLRRYFGIEPIASKITDSWLGTGNSTLYPHFGIGLADVLQSHQFPVLGGVYLYLNSEDEDYKVMNFDLRGAICLHYFTLDAAAGLGAPLANKSQGKDVILTINKLYWHAGSTMLIGNNYTSAAFFAQIGINNASIKPNEHTTTITPKTCYFLLEPRFYKDSSHFHLTFYSLPKETVEDLMLIDNNLGVNICFFRNIETKNNLLTIGAHLNAGYEDIYFDVIKDLTSIPYSDIDVSFTPYFSMPIMAGTLNTSLKIKFRKFADGSPEKAFSADIGYKCKL